MPSYYLLSFKLNDKLQFARFSKSEAGNVRLGAVEDHLKASLFYTRSDVLRAIEGNQSKLDALGVTDLPQSKYDVKYLRPVNKDSLVLEGVKHSVAHIGTFEVTDQETVAGDGSDDTEGAGDSSDAEDEDSSDSPEDPAED